MAFLIRLLAALPLLILSPVMVGVAVCAIAVMDLLRSAGRGPAPRGGGGGGEQESKRQAKPPAPPRPASVVIPNWNGRDLLAKYLPDLEIALAHDERNEILVVDNGSTDGSVDFLRASFPRVKVLALDRNLGFGGGSNAGFRAAANDIVVLLNSDMRVQLDFLAPLLAGFTDDKVLPFPARFSLAIREGFGKRRG
jgi:Predicted glycosyltransferases